MTKDTMKNKSQLAKLLATENIEVQENKVQTASFDVVNRVLTIPIFKEEHKSKHVYDMLVGHEVSHALHTPSDSWKEMAKRSKEFKSFHVDLECIFDTTASSFTVFNSTNLTSLVPISILIDIILVLLMFLLKLY